jgi:hypothetical protein
MIKISRVCEEILLSSEIALSAYLSGCLNLSAYASLIHKEVERRTKKDVSRGSIVVSLSRLKKTLPKKRELFPKIAIDSISIQSALTEFAYTKGPENRQRLAKLQRLKKLVEAPFFTGTLGAGEISIIVPQSLSLYVRECFKNERPLVVVDDLAGITITFNRKYLLTPNTIFIILRPLALKRINVFEVVSTFTELTLVIATKDMSEVLELLQKMQGKGS